MSIARMIAGANFGRAWDVSTAKFLRSFSVSSQTNTPTGVFFKPDGAEMFVTGRFGNDVSKYTLSSPWDVSSASYSQNYFLSGSSPAAEDLFFKPDGTKMYVVDSENNRIVEHDLSTPWSLSSVSVATTKSILFEPLGCFFKTDGTKLYISFGSVFNTIYEYSLSVPWDISSTGSPTSKDIFTRGMFFRKDGKKMYASGVGEYDLSTPWDVTSASFLQSFSTGTLTQGVFFSPDGKRMYVANSSDSRIDEYRIGDIASSQTFSTAGTHTFTVPSGIASVNLRLIGGSGGGASGYTTTTGDKNPVTTDYYGGDGGSGAVATKVLSVTALEALTIVVGSGGAGGAAPNVDNGTINAGSAGTDSTVTQSGSVVARADAGSGAPSASDGAGGLASASTGDATTDGVTGDGGAGGFGSSEAGAAGVAGTVIITW